MNTILHATFANADDGIRAVESLLCHHVRREDMYLILPHSASHAPGYHYDALGAVLPDTVKPKQTSAANHSSPEAVMDAEEGAALGLGLGLLTAVVVPGIGAITDAGTIVAGLMAAGAAAGGIVGGIYGYLVDRGIIHDVAQTMSDHLEAGGATLSVRVSDAGKEAEIVRIVEAFGGRLLK